MTMLRRWWTNKYKLPWTPSNVGDFTVLDLLTEFYEDVFENDKSALFEASRGEDGEIMFESTGDPLIDKWEKELDKLQFEQFTKLKQDLLDEKESKEYMMNAVEVKTEGKKTAYKSLAG